MATIGVLALQGDFAEHKKMIEACGAQALLVKHATELQYVDGLIIPGGESTTITRFGGNAADAIFETIVERATAGMPVFGTCMGSIFLAKKIEGSEQGRLGLMDIVVRRNAFGPQKFSREEDIFIPVLGDELFKVVFIRGPIIVSVSAKVEVLATVSEGIVMARQDNLLVSAFHPELTQDTRVHRYFLQIVDQHLSGQNAPAGVPAVSSGRKEAH